MRAARITAVLLACVLTATLAGGAAAKTKPKPKSHQAKKHQVAKKKAKGPVFNVRYDCAKVMPIAQFESFFAGWQGNVAYRDKVGYYPYTGGGSCGAEFVYTDGPGAGQPGAGSISVTYGTRAARGYNGFEHTATIRGHQACPNGVPPASVGSDDPRHCGPVQLTGFGDKAFECFSYITVLKGDVWIVLTAGEGVDANGQWISSATLPPTDKLEAAMKAILAKLP